MVKALPLVSESAHQDANQVYSLVAVQGTLGTADIAGTAKTVALGANPITGALYVETTNGGTGGGAGGTNVNIVTGTINAGTVSGTYLEVSYSTAVNATVAQTEVSAYKWVSVAIHTNPDPANIAFECSNDASHWDNIALVPAAFGTTGASISTFATGIFHGPIAYRYFRVHVTQTQGATVTGVVEFYSLPTAMQTLGVNASVANGTINLGTMMLTDGTQNVNTFAGDSGQNALMMVGNRKELSFTTSTVAAVGTADVSSYRSVSVHVVTQGTSSTVNFQQSNDNTNWVPLALTKPDNTLSSPATNTTAANVMFTGPLSSRYFRLNVTGITGGPTAGVIEFFGHPNPNVTTVTGQLALNGIQSVAVFSGTQQTLGTVANLNNGSVNLLTGTVTRVSNIGTLESGTVKLDPTPIPATLQFGTLGTAGGSFFGTLSAAAGAGTKHYISGVDVVMQSGTADVRILAGSSIQGTGVLAAGQFPAGGGIAKRIDPVFVTGTNSELIYHFVGAGTAFITVSYWKGV